MAKEPVIKYVGVDEYVTGIPACDLSANDYAALDTDARALVRNSPLYDYAKYADDLKAAHGEEKAARDAEVAKHGPAHDAPAHDVPMKMHAPARVHARAHAKADAQPTDGLKDAPA